MGLIKLEPVAGQMDNSSNYGEGKDPAEGASAERTGPTKAASDQTKPTNVKVDNEQSKANDGAENPSN